MSSRNRSNGPLRHPGILPGDGTTLPGNEANPRGGSTTRGGLNGSGYLNDPFNGEIDYGSYAGLLQNLFGATSGGAQDFASLLVPENGNLSAGDRKDFNKQLLDMILQMLITEEQRRYNEGLRDEQRLYDNPINALARLMGAGVSRDAAIQLLGGGSAGSGSGAPFGSPFAMPSGGPSPSERQNQLANTSFNGVNTAVSFISTFMSMGISAGVASKQMQAMDNSNFFSGQQKQAYSASTEAFHILNSAGVQSSPETTGSIDAVGKTLQGLADAGNAAAAAFIKDGGVDVLRKTAPYSSPYLNSLYKDERQSKDYDRQFDAVIDNTIAQTELSHVNKNAVESQIHLYEQQILNLRAEEGYTTALTNLTNWQSRNQEKNLEKTDAEIQVLEEQKALYGQQSTTLWLQNKVENAFQQSYAPDGSSGLQLYCDQRINYLYNEVNKLVGLNDAHSWDSKVNEILSSQENATALYELGTLYARGEITAFTNSDQQTQDLLALCRCCDTCGLFNYVNAVANGYKGESWKIGPFSGSLNHNMTGSLGNGAFDKLSGLR